MSRIDDRFEASLGPQLSQVFSGDAGGGARGGFSPLLEPLGLLPGFSQCS